MAAGKTSGTWTPGNGGPGRPKGMKNLSTLLWEQIIEKYQDKIDDGTFVSPMSFWLDILANENENRDARDKAANNLAKYFHQSLPVLVEQTIVDAPPVFRIVFEDDTDKVSTED